LSRTQRDPATDAERSRINTHRARCDWRETAARPPSGCLVP
jgi:hypothetical protein